MSFSPAWLALREPVDQRARAPTIADDVAAYFKARPTARIVDLGCGTGSNLRASYALLPSQQQWLLVDYDSALLEAARQRLTAWAGQAQARDDGLEIEKDGKKLSIAFRQFDLAGGAGPLLTHKPDLVTASALFDLISPDWIDGFAREVTAAHTAFYTVLSYDGVDSFLPPHPLDDKIINAFARHQQQDKGLGIAAGPEATKILAEAFRAQGYQTSTASSPWRITEKESELALQLLEGMARAVAETGLIAANDIAQWLAFRRVAARTPEGLLITGHQDLFARPA